MKKKLKPSRKLIDSNDLLKTNFPIVGIGGSAGALEVFQELLAAMPINTGMAFVIIQHLDPKHESMSPEILARATKMAVQEIREGLRVQPNHVYVIPPNCNLDLAQGEFHLLPRTESRGQHLPLDFFFQALAREQASSAIGVVLSGTASDGTVGLAAIKGEAGITLAQDPETAKYDGMPRSAIASGAVDLILPPQGIVEELTRISKHPYASPRTTDSKIDHQADQEDEHLFRIFTLLRKGMNTDFTLYKRSTIQRRIARRMFMNRVESLGEYVKYLETHPDEIKALFADILIHVTGFFRDAKIFETLKTKILPAYLKNRDRSLTFRIWVPGCATGEEAYTLAMIFMEVMDGAPIQTPLSIFATDVSEAALQKARSAIYPESINKDISKERLRRFFEKEEGGGYRIAKWLHELCLFSRHDVTRDPPFARLDMISCRNLLIYFDLELQKRVIPIFHYALNPKGLLLLGQSETISGFSNLFSTVDSVNKTYSKRYVAVPPKLLFPISHYTPEKLVHDHKPPETLPVRFDLQKELEQISLSRYVPPCVVVNETLDIVQSRGRTIPFLALSTSGHPSLNLLRMAQPELIVDLRMALQAARKKNAPVTKEGLCYHDDGKKKTLTISVVPITEKPPSKERYFSIFFDETHDAEAKQAKVGAHTKKRGKLPLSKSNELALALRDQQNAEMQKKLSANLEYQQILIGQHETTQEELIASNEELQSTNEELQSTNEELETAKEELQSSNEELTTLNDEMQSRNTEITQINNDLSNLLTSVNIPIIMVGHDRRIRRFTPTAEKVLKLNSTDLGLLIEDIRPDIEMPDLDELVTEVMDKVMVQEFEIQDKQGHWYLLQIRPYRTAENKIDGALIALLDIEKVREKAAEIKKTAEELKKARDDAQTVLQAQPVPLLVIGSDHHIKTANKAFCQKFRVSALDTEGKSLAELGEGQWNIPILLQKIQESLTIDLPLMSFEVSHDFPHIGKKVMSLDANKVRLAGSSEFAILLSILDITEQREIENERLKILKREQDARAEAEKASLIKDEFLAILSHELRTPLTTILSWSQMLRMGRLDAEKSKRGIEILEQSAKAQGQLIDDLLDVSRIQAGKLKLELKNIDPRKVVSASIDSVRMLAAKKSIEIQTETAPSVTTIHADPHRLQQILWNLITNAIKFSHQNGKILIKVDRLTNSSSGHYLRIQVRDNGKGIKPEFLPFIFKRFSQADNSMTRAYGGLGLGLAIVRDLVEMHGGTVEVESSGEGGGTNFIVCLPIKIDEVTKIQEPSEPPIESTESIDATPTSLHNLSILLVEDEKEVREVLTILLKSYGAKVVSTESAKQALAALKEFEPDIIISDIAMPEEDGYSLIKKIKTMNSKLAQTPAIALTAYAGKEDIKCALTAGFRAHVAKPVDSNNLVMTINQLMRRKQM